MFAGLRLRSWWQRYVPYVVGVVVAVLVLALIVFALVGAEEESRACRDRGGKLVCNYRYVGNGVGWSECNCLDRSMFR
jgi:hypothetical protein